MRILGDQRRSRVTVRTVGAIRCGLVDAARIHWPLVERGGRSWKSADTPIAPDGRAEVGVNWLCIAGPEATILVDPVSWKEPVQVDEGASDLYPMISLSRALNRLGVEPSAVTHVILTHWHIDHLAGLIDSDGNPCFPAATHYFPAADWQPLVEAVADASEEQILSAMRAVDAAGQLVLTEGDLEISEEVTIHWTGGETPGHQVVHVVSDEDEAIYLGDLVHFPNEISEPSWVAVEWRNDPELRAAREYWLGHAATRAAHVAFTHGRAPAWGCIEAEGGRFSWRYDEEPHRA